MATLTPSLLVIHTGGTIGMAAGPDGYAPRPGLVEEALARILAEQQAADPAGGRDAAAVPLAAPQAVRLVAFDPLVDSADIGPRHWNQLLDLIEAAPERAVIITHGTDTMVYSGAALTQALAGTDRTVVLTGSMQPLGVPGSDAPANLALALSSALGAAPAGVWLAFAGRQLPAGALVKAHSAVADAFRVVTDGVTHTTVADTVAESGVARARGAPVERSAGLRFADRRLAILTLSPGLDAVTLAATLATLDGAVLRVFGSGTMMADPSLQAALAAAIGRGCRIVAVSQCEQGGLSPGSYAAGAALWSASVENGGFRTAEAALIELWLALSVTAMGQG